MSTISVQVESKSGEYLKVLPAPVSRPQESQFGVTDAAIIAFFLLCSCGLIFMLLLG